MEPLTLAASAIVPLLFQEAAKAGAGELAKKSVRGVWIW